MDEIIKVEEKIENMSIQFRDGSKLSVKGKTTDTYYKSGRKDCSIELMSPIDTNLNVQKLGGK